MADELEIGIEKPGTLINAGPIEDGFGYIRRSLVEKFGRKERIELGTSRDNWSFWQHIPWDQVADEVAPLIEERCIDAADPQKMLWQSPHSFRRGVLQLALTLGVRCLAYRLSSDS